MRINFDIQDLETFLAVKETGSFQAASRRLNISQPSVSRRIRKLEDALGSVLFTRTTREVRPMLAAKRLHIRAEAILEDLRETSRAMRDESDAHAYQRARTVNVATIPSVVGALLVPALRRFPGGGDGARIRILDVSANDVAVAVAEGEADLGICSVPMLEPTTSFEPLFSDPLVLAIPRDSTLAGLSGVAWADLEKQTLILPARGTGNRLLIDEALARTVHKVRWSLEVGRTSTALDLVAEGIGVAPLPRMALAGSTPQRVRQCRITSPEVMRPIGLLTRYGQVDTKRTAALKTALRDAARDIQTVPQADAPGKA